MNFCNFCGLITPSTFKNALRPTLQPLTLPTTTSMRKAVVNTLAVSEGQGVNNSFPH